MMPSQQQRILIGGGMDSADLALLTANLFLRKLYATDIASLIYAGRTDTVAASQNLRPCSKSHS